jgi:hypothetical protein
MLARLRHVYAPAGFELCSMHSNGVTQVAYLFACELQEEGRYQIIKRLAEVSQK